MSVGCDLEEFNVKMNANVETKNNIIGDTSVTLDSCYQPAGFCGSVLCSCR